jgi:membrane fusion protein (multidrug efflux system)
MSESNHPNAAPASNGNGNGKRKVLLTSVLVIVLMAGAAWFAYWYLVGRNYQSTDDAYVAGNVIQITPQVSGTVVEINADDTDFVPQGKVLIRLDPTDADFALKQAEAELGQAVRQARTLYANDEVLIANINQRKAELAQMKTDVSNAQEDLQRRESVIASGAVSKEELQHAQTALSNALNAKSAAESSLASMQQQLLSSRAQTDGTAVDNHPSVQAAAARVREAYLARVRCDITAPAAGQVAKRSVQIGQRIQTGAPLMAIIPLDQVWVDANFKEGQLRRMRIGQPVQLRADIYGSKVEYSGRVVGLGAGTGAAFSLLPAQNATGNWIKIVQRIPVRVALDKEQLKAHPLRIGLSMQAEISVNDDSGKLLADAVRTAPVSTTTQMDTEAAAAEVLVTQIIHNNLSHAVASAVSGKS